MTWHPGIFAILAPAAEAAADPSGNVFLGGGAISGGDAVDMDRWTSSTDVWTARTDVPSPPRQSRYNMCYDGSTYQYLYGGAEADTDRFDDAGNSWTARGRNNGNGFGQSGWANSRAWHCGGTTATTANEGYSEGDNKWTNFTSLTTGRAQGASFVINDDVYISYGNTGDTSIHSYDPVGDAWSTETAGPSPTRTQTAGAYIGDYGYVCGGLSDGQGMDEYYRTGDSWSAKTNLTASRQMHGMGNCGTNHCVAIAGFWAGVYYGSVFLYQKSGDSWSTETSVSPARSGVHCAEG